MKQTPSEDKSRFAIQKTTVGVGVGRYDRPPDDAIDIALFPSFSLNYSATRGGKTLPRYDVPPAAEVNRH